MPRSKLRTKVTANGKIRGRPRKNADDFVGDMPSGKPGRSKSGLSVVRDVLLASRAGAVKSMMVDKAFPADEALKVQAQNRTRLARVRKKARGQD